MGQPLAAKSTVITHESIIAEISKIMSEKTGVQLQDKQAVMVENRLERRRIELELNSLQDYWTYFLENKDDETLHLIGLLTTHHTFFFREFEQFEIFHQGVLQDIIKAKREKNDNTLRIWSAACSHGQEVYSLALYFDYWLKKLAPEMKLEIIGSDIDPESIRIAENGVYKYDEIKEVPIFYLANYFAKGQGDLSTWVKVKSTLKEFTQFKSFNLQNLSSTKLFHNETFDFIFCRNVFIYFDKELVDHCMHGFKFNLQPWGQLILGVSESIDSKAHQLKKNGTCIYTKELSHKPDLKLVQGQKTKAHSPLRVLCVDDSPVILSLLKKILTPINGFEIIATAENGQEALDKIKNTHFDVMTLDIHMPIMDGPTLLKKLPKKNGPAVVMLSSVTKEQSGLALETLELGALDYIEKPSLANLAEKQEEIRNKLKMAHLIHTTETDPQKMAAALTSSKQLDRSFVQNVKEEKIKSFTRVLILPFNRHSEIDFFIKDSSNANKKFPKTIILIDGDESLAQEAIKKACAHIGGHLLNNITEANASLLKEGTFYITPLNSGKNLLSSVSGEKNLIMLAAGPLSLSALTIINASRPSYFLIDDYIPKNKLFVKISDQFPMTSFSAMSFKILT